jgi:Flp pilus assembly protein TadB
MNDGNFPPRTPPGRPESPWAEDPQNRPMHHVDRQQFALEQQMMEAKLEIIRAHRQQKEARVSRLVTFLFVFAAAGLVFYVLDAKGYGPKVSILSSVAVIVVIGTWWAYRKPYGA